MKAIMVMFDSLNRRMLPPYNGHWVHAPNFERLTEQTVTFDNFYAGSLTSIPARRELHTGRYNFLHRGWGAIEPFDDSMPELLKRHGVYTHLVTDHLHYFEDGGATYHGRYNSWEFVRGQEGDPWKGQVKDPEIPETVKPLSGRPWRQDWVNRNYIKREEDYPQFKTFERGLEFIRTNHDQDGWFLQIEAYDPHEPYFVPEKYKALYPHAYDGPHFDWPPYGPVEQTPEQVQHMRYEYAALVSMCDAHLGKVLDIMDELNLWRDTLLIVNTDHGFILGERASWGKIVQPFYNEVAHLPLFIWDPRAGCRGERRAALIQTIDLAPTLLEYFEVERSPDMQGRPLRATIASNAPVREAGLFGIYGGQVNCTDSRYVYMRAPVSPDNEPLYLYTLMPTHMHQPFSVDELQHVELAEPFSFTKGCQTLRVKAESWFNPYPLGTLLFDLKNDPGQTDPIQDPFVEEMMTQHLVRLLRESDAPEEQFERFGLPRQ